MRAAGPLAATRRPSPSPLPEHRKKSELVYAYLREQILSGTYAPGQRLTLQGLAAELSTSHMPIREAALRLERDGLLQIAPHRDMRVTPLSPRDAHELFRIRAALEALAARTACEHGAAACVPAMRAANGEFAAALARGDLAAMAAANWAFHRSILAAADNLHLAQLLEDLWARCQRFRSGYKLIPGRAAATIAEHDRIIAAMERGDPAAADATTFRHVDAARVDLEDLLARRGPG
ncbi:MAG: GntR family transcriptional regulator [Alphaproteobacteria bacterium]|nr:GntR family transcriptional regulator [Alphaproteobacteria bacterium]